MSEDTHTAGDGRIADDGRTRVAIACQGGGSHTAFTAGVLQRLLAEDDIEIVALSGTSGGAVCALLTWYGLTQGDRDLAAGLLDGFWHDIAATAPWDAALNRALVTAAKLEGALLLPAVSPYYVPVSGLDHLRQLLAERVPAAAFATPTAEPLLIVSAVDVLSGAFTIFSSAADDPEERAGIDAVLASAAIPNLFRAVRIGERLFWDGLFSQNPPLRKLFDAQPEALWVVRINPATTRREPRLWADILDRRNELTGNLSLNQELTVVDKINKLARDGRLEGTGYRYVPWDVIALEGEPGLGLASKVDRRPAFLAHLMARGRQEAEHFLARRAAAPT